MRSTPARLVCLVIGAAAMAMACGEDPAPSSTRARQLQVVVRDEQGANPMTLTIVDPGGVLATAEPASANELNSVIPALPAERIAAVDSTPGGGLLVVWAGFGCDRTGSLALAPDASRVTVAPSPIENCDLVPSYRGVVITTVRPIVGTIRAVLEPTEVLGA